MARTNRVSVFWDTVRKGVFSYFHATDPVNTPIATGLIWDLLQPLTLAPIKEIRGVTPLHRETGSNGEGLWFNSLIFIFKLVNDEYFSFRLPTTNPEGSYLVNGKLDINHVDVVALASYIIDNVSLGFCNETGIDIVSLVGGYYGYDIRQDQ